MQHVINDEAKLCNDDIKIRERKETSKAKPIIEKRC
jgi:hypothetical protein